MWQRIQTVFLVIVILSLIASIFLPIWVMSDTAENKELYAFHFSSTEQGENGKAKQTEYIPYATTAILFIASITIAMIETTRFRDRLLQIKLGTLNSLLLAGGLGSAVYFATSMVKSFDGGVYGFGLWLPGVAVVCNWLAMRFIRRDEKLVRDSDRLR